MNTTNPAARGLLVFLAGCVGTPTPEDSAEPQPDTQSAQDTQEDSPQVDLDEDGYLSPEDGGADCDDLDPEVYPGAPEVPYDGIDQDCDGADLTDVDGDGSDAEEAGGADCDDSDPSVFAGAEEVPYDGIDQDCDGADLTDVDGDGFLGVDAGGDDCDDSDDSLGAWDDSKAFTYEYDITPWWSGSDLIYDGENGVLNDGVESYYGDSLSEFSWWQYTSPSIIIHLPALLNASELGAFVSHGIGGGVTAPSSIEVFHRPEGSKAWTSIGSSAVEAQIGWASTEVEMLSAGGDLKLILEYAGEHTIVGELSVKGSCGA